jgi:TRAP-type uncharacterized transport system substrate-binding protein
MLSGEANAILHQAGEAIWAELARRKRVRYLPLDAGLVDRLEREYYCVPEVIAKGRFDGMEQDVRCLQWTDLIVVASSAVPAEIGHALARSMTERKSQIEDLLYVDDPARYSHLTSRVDPRKVYRELGVPAHPGAARWAEEQGLS